MKKFQILVVVALLLSLAAWFASHREQQRYGLTDSELLLPELQTQLGMIDTIRIVPAGGSPITLTLTEDGQWQVLERSNYPADTTALRGVLRKLAAATKLEAKTTRAENYALLGLQDVDLAQDTTLQITATASTKSETPNTLVDLLVGKPSRGGSYVRQVGDTQTWLISEEINLPRSTPDWLQKSLLDIERKDLQSIQITSADGSKYSLIKEDPEQTDFDLKPSAPKGRDTNAANLNRLAAAVSGLRIVDVVTDLPPNLSWSKAVYRRFDGLELRLEVAKHDAERYLRLTAQSTSQDSKSDSAVAQESARINALAEGRIFSVGQYPVDAMTMTYPMMLKSLPEIESAS